MTGFEASTVSQVFAGLIATALYAAAYLSFVRLLRFPRNWVTLGPSAVGTTGLLVALTVAWVSLSGHGLDTVGLAVSTAFIIVIFIIPYVSDADYVIFWCLFRFDVFFNYFS